MIPGTSSNKPKNKVWNRLSLQEKTVPHKALTIKIPINYVTWSKTPSFISSTGALSLPGMPKIPPLAWLPAISDVCSFGLKFCDYAVQEASEEEVLARYKDVSPFSIGFLTDLNARKSKIALFDFRLKKNAMDGFFSAFLIFCRLSKGRREKVRKRSHGDCSWAIVLRGIPGGPSTRSRGSDQPDRIFRIEVHTFACALAFHA